MDLSILKHHMDLLRDPPLGSLSRQFHTNQPLHRTEDNPVKKTVEFFAGNRPFVIHIRIYKHIYTYI
jgi:hypothetical protein